LMLFHFLSGYRVIPLSHFHVVVELFSALLSVSALSPTLGSASCPVSCLVSTFCFQLRVLSSDPVCFLKFDFVFFVF